MTEGDPGLNQACVGYYFCYKKSVRLVKSSASHGACVIRSDPVEEGACVAL
jgi:hypothetical protein